MRRFAHWHLPHVRDEQESDDEKQFHDIRTSPGLTVVATVAVHRGPIASPDGRELMVTNYGNGSASVIDTDTAAVVQTITGTDEPYAIAIGAARSDPAGAYIRGVSPA